MWVWPVVPLCKIQHIIHYHEAIHNFLMQDLAKLSAYKNLARLKFFYYGYSLFCVEMFLSDAKNRKNFSAKILLDEKLETQKMANNFALLCYSNNIRTHHLHFLFICDTCVSLHLLLPISFCLRYMITSTRTSPLSTNSTCEK